MMCDAIEDTVAAATFGTTDREQVIAIAAVFGTKDVYQHNREASWDQYDMIMSKHQPSERLENLWEMVTPVLVSRLTYNGAITQTPQELIDEARKVAVVLGINIEVMYQQAVADNPEPKSWANLNADGTPKSTKKAKKKAVKKVKKATAKK